MSDELPKLERSPILPNEQEDKEIWQPRWLDCAETGNLYAKKTSKT